MPSQLPLHTISILRIVWVAINITRRSHNMQCYHSTRPLFMTQYCRSNLGVAIVNVHNERLFGWLGENPLSFKSLRLVPRLSKSRKRLTSFEMRFGVEIFLTTRCESSISTVTVLWNYPSLHHVPCQ